MCWDGDGDGGFVCEGVDLTWTDMHEFVNIYTTEMIEMVLLDELSGTTSRLGYQVQVHKSS